MKTRFALISTSGLLITVLLGCATIKDIPKGIAGISTRILEDGRKDALKKSFLLDYNSCYVKVKYILNQEVNKPYIYAEDSKKKMITIYLSELDTTSVGIFFTEESGSNTLIEVSSPSVYAKEETARIIFTGIDTLLKPAQPQGSGLAIK